ncbi:MAG: SRPBCC domain-containing protein [Theionarchaea archaeon]|nr:SRPBCC domain-containing protein [Theionarchaea archaeon]
MDKIIYQSVELGDTPENAFKMFTENEHLEKWLTNVADVEPRVGGKYELFWVPEDREHNSTIGCKVLALNPGKLISFEWKGPPQHQFMNEVIPLTHVMVSFIPCEKGTEVHLIHTGWKNTPEWEEARQWFEKAWEIAFSELQKHAGK